MRINMTVPSTTALPFATAAAAAATNPSFRAPATGEVALLDLHGVGFYSLRDARTGYGRSDGYASLANASRAAYMLSAGADRSAAGVFEQGDRFFVRALSALPGQKPHAFAPMAGPSAPQLLHFEGNADAHFAWVRDTRLVVMVDGATKIWTRDAHHQPPAA